MTEEETDQRTNKQDIFPDHQDQMVRKNQSYISVPEIPGKPQDGVLVALRDTFLGGSCELTAGRDTDFLSYWKFQWNSEKEVNLESHTVIFL